MMTLTFEGRLWLFIRGVLENYKNQKIELGINETSLALSAIVSKQNYFKWD